MATLTREEHTSKHTGAWFDETHWSVVLAAGQSDPQRRQEALEKLCGTYWQPIFVWIRCSGYDVPDAEDLTQGFFAHLLEGSCFSRLSADRGKFRSFLLRALQHFLADHRDHDNAAKRGKGTTCLPLDEISEDRYLDASSRAVAPEMAFDRRWALVLLDRAFVALQQEFQAAGKAEQFAELAVFLAAEGGANDYVSAASNLGTTSGAVAVAVHRLRSQYRDCIRREIAQTVDSPADAREEMRYLLEVLSYQPLSA